MTEQRPTVHVAGPYDPSTGQRCTRCDAILDDGLAGKSWPADQPTPRGWIEGSLVLVDGNSMMLVDVATTGEMCTDDEKAGTSK